MIIKNKGKYCYVENDDCYILYFFFKYKLKENKCYFHKKYINKVIKVLKKNSISFQCSIYESNIINNSQYDFYKNLGIDKYKFDKELQNLKINLLNIVERRQFNKVYNKLIKLI